MNRRWILGSLWLAVSLLVFGCDRDRQQAHDKVVDAMNAKKVSVSSNQCAVLRLQTGYAAIVFSSVGPTSTFKVFFSESGGFSPDQRPVKEESFRESQISVAGALIHIGYDGPDASSVMLDWEDTKTGITLTTYRSLSDISVSSLKFATNRGLDPGDLLKSVGQKK